eukprot:9495821-Pyramimonas_sp.AAC.1
MSYVAGTSFERRLAVRHSFARPLARSLIAMTRHCSRRQISAGASPGKLSRLPRALWFVSRQARSPMMLMMVMMMIMMMVMLLMMVVVRVVVAVV